MIAPAVSPIPGFDPIRDFTHIACIGGPPNVVVVNRSLGVRSLKDLIELGRRGQAIDYVSPGVEHSGICWQSRSRNAPASSCNRS